MKFRKITIVVDAESADALPDILAVGRGADPRGHDIEAWEKAEAERVARVEARRRAAEAEAQAQARKVTKPEAAE
jgi:hypothetical protein